MEQQKQEFQAEINLHSEILQKKDKLIRELRAENVDLQGATTQKIAELKETFCEKKLPLAEEMECLLYWNVKCP